MNDVFAQAGMTRSNLPSSSSPLPPPSSHGYVGTVGAVQLQQLGVTEPATTDVTAWTQDYGKEEGGGAYSIIGDLATWGGSCLGNSLLPTAMVDARMQTTTSRTPATTVSGSSGSPPPGMGTRVRYWDGSPTSYCNTKSGAVFALLVNSTDGLFLSEVLRDPVFPGIK